MGHISRPTRWLVRAIVSLMDVPVSIPCALSLAEGMQMLSSILAQPEASRAEVGRRVCDAFGFFDPHGRPQVTSCLSALCRLATATVPRPPAPPEK